MKRYVRLLIIVAIIAAVVLMLRLLPAGYDTDLSRVGAGQAAAVLIHDPNIVQSGNLMHAVDRVRGDFEPALAFLVADQNLGDGAAFAARHGLPIATLAVFDGDGTLIGVYSGAPDATVISGWIADRLAGR